MISAYYLYRNIMYTLYTHVRIWQESVSLWLSTLHMSQYEETMVEAGYDDIDFICDIALDDLHDVGISKRGESVTVDTLYINLCMLC